MQPQDIPNDQRPSSKAAWAFLVGQWNVGLFTVQANGDGTYSAHFTDDGEVIPLQDMAYNSDIGLFRRSQFPQEKESS